MASPRSVQRVVASTVNGCRRPTSAFGTAIAHRFAARNQSWQQRRFASPVHSPVTEQDDWSPKEYRIPAFKWLAVISGSILAIGFGFEIAAIPTADKTKPMTNPPSDGQTILDYIPIDPAAVSLEDELQNHPILRALNADERLRASRPYLKIPPMIRPHNYSAGVLAEAGKVGVPPIAFISPEGAAMIQVQHLGSDVAGRPGEVHGGLVTTLMDEGLARACFPALPNKVGVTATLKINYQTSCPTDSWVVLRAETQKVEGRKAWVKGTLHRLIEPGKEKELEQYGSFREAEKWLGEVICEAEALFIEPRNAKAMPKLYVSS